MIWPLYSTPWVEAIRWTSWILRLRLSDTPVFKNLLIGSLFPPEMHHLFLFLDFEGSVFCGVAIATKAWLSLLTRNASTPWSNGCHLGWIWWEPVHRPQDLCSCHGLHYLRTPTLLVSQYRMLITTAAEILKKNTQHNMKFRQNGDMELGCSGWCWKGLSGKYTQL